MVTVFLVCCVAFLAYVLFLRAEENPVTSTAQGLPGAAAQENLPAPLEADAAPTHDITLYFSDAEGRQLVPERRAIRGSEYTVENCRQALQALIDGPAQGTRAILPKETRVRGLYLLPTGELVIDFPVDLDLEMRKARSAAAEALLVYGIVNTLTQPDLQGPKDPAVTAVRFLIGGSPAGENFPEHLDVSAPIAPDPSWLAATQG